MKGSGKGGILGSLVAFLSFLLLFLLGGLQRVGGSCTLDRNVVHKGYRLVRDISIAEKQRLLKYSTHFKGIGCKRG